ncbi:reverse transcriptase [Gossypium australe]|uniref:Reverse transcriptase n=1 Tax=Gossypium australe TaxID=47621 RepID=A0A5B6VTV0_9ROSI|nr:reverse transcriptase [Gossypium australe]
MVTLTLRFFIDNAVDRIANADGGMVEGEGEIERVACLCFTDLFTTRGPGDIRMLLSCISVRVADNMNIFLQSEFIVEEVLLAVWGMAPVKVAGSDGTPALFY